MGVCADDGSTMSTLDSVRPTLPGYWYYDLAHYERELQAVWYRDWVCAGREESLPRPGDYIVLELGTQSIVVTRLPDERLHAFHNTCRHRGSILCRDAAGHFRNGRVVCPYHSWTYTTDGHLAATPGRFETPDFKPADHGLYPVHVDNWRGFVFVNLAGRPANSLADFLGDEVRPLANWPLEDLRSVHREVSGIACNWKVFWENFSECYHCPRVHPELCRVMPVYGEGVLSAGDLPGRTPAVEGETAPPAVGNGAKTWTLNGELAFPVMAGPTAEELGRGVAFACFSASLFVLGHPDYARSVRIRPTGPESVELTIDWLLPADVPVEDEAALEPILGLARRVIAQDAAVCELNQRGLHSHRHMAGVLMPQEYELWHFHESLRSKLATLADAPLADAPLAEAPVADVLAAGEPA